MESWITTRDDAAACRLGGGHVTAADTSPATALGALLAGGHAPTPVLALAPMQDVTDLPFWRLICQYGGPDVYFTEYFRVHATSVPERWICESITANPTGRPVIAQLIGNDIPSLVRTAQRLQTLPVAGIDLNLGCPAPVVYRKCAGGGLLRDLARVDAILAALRDAVQVKLSVKTRVGFESPDGFAQVLEVLARHPLDLVTVHGRTVAERYRSPVRYELIALAARTLPCPVFANGNVHSPRQALELHQRTETRGLMIGRGAIRNPWLFEQIRQAARGATPRLPTGRDVRDYVRRLYEATGSPGFPERAHVQRIKKYLNYLGLGVEPTGRFLAAMRRATQERELEHILDEHLDHDRPMPLEPLPVPLGAGDLLAGEHRS